MGHTGNAVSNVVVPFITIIIGFLLIFFRKPFVREIMKGNRNIGILLTEKDRKMREILSIIVGIIAVITGFIGVFRGFFRG